MAQADEAGGGGGGATAPYYACGQKKHTQVIFGQIHLIFEQALDKIFGQETSAPERNLSRKPIHVP